MTIRLLLIMMALALAAPASAEAIPPPGWERKALETAQRVWHPACGQITITYADPATFGGDASWGGWAYLGQCEIYEPINHEWIGYPEFCTDVLHEGGHAAGVTHRDHGIMMPFAFVIRNDVAVHMRKRVIHIISWVGADRRCIRPIDLIRH